MRWPERAPTTSDPAGSAMAELPKISLVTPSYNQGRFLEATITSILSQNYPNLEYIIVDGGSTDDSVEIIKKYAHHLAFWCSEKDKGQYDALNKGLSRATGEVMAWLNSDDMYFPWTLKTVGSIMAKFPQVEWLTTLQPGWWDWYGTPLGFGNVAGYSREAFLDGCYLPGVGARHVGWIQQESTFWRRSAWEKAGASLSTEFHMAGDFNLWARFFQTSELYGVGAPIAGFRFQDQQKTKHAEYIAQATVSLNRVREEAGWKDEAAGVKTARRIGSRVPVVRRRSGKHYKGKKITRTNVSNAGADWQIDEYSF
jgi:hypothetical protein